MYCRGVATGRFFVTTAGGGGSTVKEGFDEIGGAGSEAILAGEILAGEILAEEMEICGSSFNRFRRILLGCLESIGKAL